MVHICLPNPITFAGFGTGELFLNCDISNGGLQKYQKFWPSEISRIIFICYKSDLIYQTKIGDVMKLSLTHYPFISFISLAE